MYNSIQCKNETYLSILRKNFILLFIKFRIFCYEIRFPQFHMTRCEDNFLQNMKNISHRG